MKYYLLNGCKGTLFVRFKQTNHHFSPEKFGSFESFSYLCKQIPKGIRLSRMAGRKRVSGCSGNGNRVWRLKPR